MPQVWVVTVISMLLLSVRTVTAQRSRESAFWISTLNCIHQHFKSSIYILHHNRRPPWAPPINTATNYRSKKPLGKETHSHITWSGLHMISMVHYIIWLFICKGQTGVTTNLQHHPSFRNSGNANNYLNCPLWLGDLLPFSFPIYIFRC